MKKGVTMFGGVLAGIVVLFVAWLLGGYVGANLFPQSDLINKMETLPTKVGSSLGVLVASLFLRRYFLRSFRFALACLAATEVVAFLIITQVTGLSPFTLSNLRFNGGWLYALTWNVVVVFLLGAAIGHLWDRRTAKPQQLQ